eukprot:gene2662-2701_t
MISARVGAQLCLFTSAMDSAFYEAASRLGIRLENAEPYLTSKFHPQNSRFFMYRDFLEANREQYDRVMLSDIRDVFFQADPFNTYFNHEVCFSLEDTLISSDSVNTNWLRDIYGDELAAEIMHNPVSCSGTTIGSIDAMIRYVHEMCIQIGETEYDYRFPNDQGMHNYIAWKLRPGYVTLDWKDVVVQTVGCTGQNSIWIEHGMALVDGRFAPVIHQWDRHPRLLDHVATEPRFRITA